MFLFDIFSFNGVYCGPTKLVIYWTELWILLGWLIGGFFVFEILRQLFTYCFSNCCKKRRMKKGKSEFWTSADDARSPLLELNINDDDRLRD